MEREAKPDYGREKEREKNETPMMQTRRVLKKVAGIGFQVWLVMGGGFRSGVGEHGRRSRRV